MSNLENNRLVQAFARLRAADKKGLLPFLTAGYPDLDTTALLLHEMRRRGIAICELGIPFSDPIADGPVIQASYTHALAAGIRVEDIFAMVRRYRADEAKQAGNQPPLALITMVSYSIVFRRGVEKYIRDAVAAGIDGLIVPDLPLDEAAGVEQLAAASGLANILLISPTTPPPRRLEIARHSRGFIYYMSVAGITGERDRLPQATIDGVAELRTHTDTPVCVGFGISNAKTVETVCRVADGAIVGSAIVHRLREAMANGTPREKIVALAGNFVAELAAPLA